MDNPKANKGVVSRVWDKVVSSGDSSSPKVFSNKPSSESIGIADDHQNSETKNGVNGEINKNIQHNELLNFNLDNKSISKSTETSKDIQKKYR